MTSKYFRGLAALALGATMSLAAGAGAGAVPPEHYRGTAYDLGSVPANPAMPGVASYYSARDLNDAGDALFDVGAQDPVTSDFYRRPLLWPAGGAPQWLGSGAVPGKIANARAVNGSRTVVGAIGDNESEVYTGDKTMRAVRWLRGKPAQPLAVPAGTVASIAHDVNRFGFIVGTVYGASGSSAVLWTPWGSIARVVSLGPTTQGVAIADTGSFVAVTSPSPNRDESYLVMPWRTAQLNCPDGCRAIGISANGGYVVGSVGGYVGALLHPRNTPTELGPFSIEFEPVGVTNEGLVVGSNEGSVGVWDDGVGDPDISDRMTPDTTVVPSSATAVNNRGQILTGYGDLALLTPVP